MENKIIEKIDVNSKITKIIFEDDGDRVRIKSEKGDILLYSYHDQDCCEHVYAEFKKLKDYLKDIEEKKFKQLIIKVVKEAGIILSFDEKVKVFIPCYNEQNGYYGSDLELVISFDGWTKKIDISNYVKDNIN